MPTQENLTKRKIRAVLNKFPNIYDYMPVPYGYGPSSLDYLLCVSGLFVGVEAKAPGKTPTPRQHETIRRIEAAGGRVFVIDGTPNTDTCEQLERYLTTLSKFAKPVEEYNPAWTHGEVD
jgi:hypothetical protein